jgi:hypothetical protein
MSTVEQFGLATVEAVTVLAKSDHFLQVLTVLYAAIDTMA